MICLSFAFDIPTYIDKDNIFCYSENLGKQKSFTFTIEKCLIKHTNYNNHTLVRSLFHTLKDSIESEHIFRAVWIKKSSVDSSKSAPLTLNQKKPFSKSSYTFSTFNSNDQINLKPYKNNKYNLIICFRKMGFIYIYTYNLMIFASPKWDSSRVR